MLSQDTPVSTDPVPQPAGLAAALRAIEGLGARLAAERAARGEPAPQPSDPTDEFERARTHPTEEELAERAADLEASGENCLRVEGGNEQFALSRWECLALVRRCPDLTLDDDPLID